VTPIKSTLAQHELQIEERFVRASDVGASSLPVHVKSRLAVLAGSRMTTEGVLVIDSREHRTQGQNRNAARPRLVALIQQATVRPRTRRPTKPSRAAKERRLTAKKLRANVKGLRSGSRGDKD
jgi:ribosome-associated protein